MDVNNRDEFIVNEDQDDNKYYEQSDIVTILLYMPFINKERLKGFQIEEDWARKYFDKAYISQFTDHLNRSTASLGSKKRNSLSRTFTSFGSSRVSQSAVHSPTKKAPFKEESLYLPKITDECLLDKDQD